MREKGVQGGRRGGEELVWSVSGAGKKAMATRGVGRAPRGRRKRCEGYKDGRVKRIWGSYKHGS